MILAARVAFATAAGPYVFAIAVVAAIATGVLYWRRSSVREPWVHVALVALRTTFVLAIGLLLADPLITRETLGRPRVDVVWDGAAALDVRDAPDGATRREALGATVAAARRGSLGQRCELVEGASDGPFDATLVLTDGLADLDALTPLDGPVTALVAARDRELPDLAVVGVLAPALGVAGAPEPLDVTIRCLGARGRRAVVTVSDAAHVLGAAAHDVASEDEVVTLGMTVVVQAEGLQRIAVDVAGVTGEAETANNRYETWVSFEQPERRVLFLESQPSWEGKFVRRALDDDPAFRVDYVARVSKAADLAQPAAGTDPTAPPAGPVRPAPSDVRAALADAARLDRYDAVILGPLDAADLGDAGAARLASFVGMRGGGLVVLGGNDYAGSVLSSRGAFADLLPVAIPPSSFGARASAPGRDKDSVLLEPASGAEARTVFAGLGSDPAKVLERLQRLGGQYLRLGALKPGAVALAEDASAHAPLLAGQPFGAGRVVLVAPQDTWKLAVGAPDDAAEASARLWTGLVSWAASGATEPVALRLESARAVAGEPSRVTLVVRTPTFDPVRATDVEASCALVAADRPDVTAAPVPLAFVASPGAPGVYVASVALPEPGEWSIHTEVAGQVADAAIRVVAPDPASRTRPDPLCRERFAAAVAARGGTVVETGDDAALASAFPSFEPTRAVVTTRPARSAAWAFLLPLLFCAEVFLRRWYGID